MSRPLIWFVILFIAATLGIDRSLAYVAGTAAAYDGACGRLPGAAGLLQKVGLLHGPQGSCDTVVVGDRTECRSPQTSCTNAGGRTGSCTQLARICACQVD